MEKFPNQPNRRHEPERRQMPQMFNPNVRWESLRARDIDSGYFLRGRDGEALQVINTRRENDEIVFELPGRAMRRYAVNDVVTAGNEILPGPPPEPPWPERSVA